jgi:primosomal protein N' (replication factor Y)
MKALNPTQRTRARRLRREQTDAEVRLWFHLRNCQMSGAKFRRQQPLGPFVADFCCMEVGLVIEVDGGQHSERERADARRTQLLEEQGFLVLRFWNNEVLEQTEVVVERIRMVIEQCRKEGRRYGIKSPSP